MKNEKSFSWKDEERGEFKEEYIPPCKIPTIAYTPWGDKPIPIPPAAIDPITAKVQDKLKAGIYELVHRILSELYFCGQEEGQRLPFRS